MSDARFPNGGPELLAELDRRDRAIYSAIRQRALEASVRGATPLPDFATAETLADTAAASFGEGLRQLERDDLRRFYATVWEHEELEELLACLIVAAEAPADARQPAPAGLAMRILSAGTEVPVPTPILDRFPDRRSWLQQLFTLAATAASHSSTTPSASTVTCPLYLRQPDQVVAGVNVRVASAAVYAGGLIHLQIVLTGPARSAYDGARVIARLAPGIEAADTLVDNEAILTYQLGPEDLEALPDIAQLARGASRPIRDVCQRVQFFVEAPNAPHSDLGS